jgi:hypothetical protein
MTMAELEDDLRALAHRAVDASKEASVDASPRAPVLVRRSSRRVLVAAVAVSIVVVVVIGVALARRDSGTERVTTGPTASDATDGQGLICGETIATSFPAITSAPDTLVSGESLRSVTVCRYGGLNTPAPDGTLQVGKLQQSGTVTDQATMSALVDAVNAGQRVPDGAISCPVDFGIYYTVNFRYVDGPLETVVVGGSGCRFAQNGSAGHWATPELLAGIASLAGAPQ